MRVAYVNINYHAGPPGEDGFEVLVVTEDDERHVLTPSPVALPALLMVLRDCPVLLFDPDARTVIGANLVGEWLPLDWSKASQGSDSSSSGS